MMRSCGIEGCTRTHYGRGMCSLHWQRWKKYGDAAVNKNPSRVGGTLKARFYSKVQLPNSDGCMLWTGSLSAKGYGRFGINGKVHWAHRVAYELLVGRIPKGLEIDHVKANGCMSKACCAPDHLEAVTHAENMRRIAKAELSLTAAGVES